MKRIICQFHKESTPSLVLYGDRYYCFGCGAKGKSNTLKNIDQSLITDDEVVVREDLNETFNYINSLNRIDHRGLSFPCDAKGYYIVWPNGQYYKKRLFGEEKSKYRCPIGHKKPLFIALDAGPKAKGLIVVEGEINAMSLALCIKDYSIVSPGGSTEFDKKYLPYLVGYDRVFIVADKDSAGAKAVINLKSILVQYTPYIKYSLLEQDINEILIKYGQEKVRETLKEKMGLS